MRANGQRRAGWRSCPDRPFWRAGRPGAGGAGPWPHSRRAQQISGWVRRIGWSRLRRSVGLLKGAGV